MRGTPFWASQRAPRRAGAVRGRSYGLALVMSCALAVTAQAAPAADLVITWAPGRDLAPVAAAARAAGAAVVDQSPQPHRDEQAGPQLAAALKRGVEAYDALRIDDAWTALEEAHALADRTGAVGLSASQLSDLFVYRGLVRLQREDATGAWDELVAAMVIAPTRAFDPARFPPRVLTELERARGSVVSRTPVELVIAAPPDCAVIVDGASIGTGDQVTIPVGPIPGEPGSAGPPNAVSVLPGVHWARVTCTAHEPWSARIDVTASMRVDAKVVTFARPTESDILVQARAVNARAVLVVEAVGSVATLRLVGADGRERDRRTVNVGVNLDGVAASVRELLEPVTEVKRWYKSPWVWAAGAAVLAAAIAIPLTAAFVGDDEPTASVLPPPVLP